MGKAPENGKDDKNQPAESKVKNLLENDGWVVLRNGYPDFLAIRNDKIRFVEVKTGYLTLTREQKAMVDILINKLGCVVDIARVNGKDITFEPCIYKQPIVAPILEPSGVFLKKACSKYKTHYFSKEIAERLIDTEISLNKKTAFQISYDTGARAGEIIKISGEHFDYSEKKMILWDSKKKGWKTVPLSDITLRYVQTYLLATKKTGRLFDVDTKTLNNWLHEACKREWVKPDIGTRIRWHSWRGTFVRTHHNLGAKWLMQVTGDSYTTLLQYYQELTDEDLRRIKQNGL